MGGDLQGLPARNALSAGVPSRAANHRLSLELRGIASGRRLQRERRRKNEDGLRYILKELRDNKSSERRRGAVSDVVEIGGGVISEWFNDL